MILLALGLNHHSAPLAIREQVAFNAGILPQALAALIEVPGVLEAAILSTCNRTELYCAAMDAEAVSAWLAHFSRVERAVLAPFLYTFSGDVAVRHAFRVACGLDSMVLGEPQILGQMKDAMRAAENANTLGTLLGKLFQRAFATAKEVRTCTEIGANTVSMAAAAVQLAERIFGNLSEQGVLFVGAGEMIELCAAHFCAHNPKRITVANRTLERGRALAERFHGETLRLDELAEALPLHDIIISCTASPLPLIGLGLVERALKARRHRPLFMVDLAVPRDIEPEAGDLDDVFLYTVDDLACVVESGVESRQAAVEEAERIITAQVDEFLRWQSAREIVPLIRKLRDNVERTRRHELELAQKRLAAGAPPDVVLEALSQRLANKFLHAPTEALQTADAQHRPALQQATLRLFHLRSEESAQ
ncbi:MAG: glutamyl-tRNA reductase [Zoogloeaceae bacterium]|jgi:glutamyl-tRNA reductase|nr:glutamyl-tRNA reductase [Zoogloeaceae bacterium]